MNLVLCMELCGNFTYGFFLLNTCKVSLVIRGIKTSPIEGKYCWIQGKIHMSDQASLRICNSVSTVQCVHVHLLYMKPLLGSLEVF